MTADFKLPHNNLNLPYALESYKTGHLTTRLNRFLRSIIRLQVPSNFTHKEKTFPLMPTGRLETSFFRYII